VCSTLCVARLGNEELLPDFMALSEAIRARKPGPESSSQEEKADGKEGW